MVPHGSLIIFDVNGTTGGLAPVDDTDLRSRIIAGLAPYFTVMEVAITRGSTLSNIIDFQWFHWNYSAVVTLRTRSDYADVEDVRSVLIHAFYDAGGAFPTVTIRTLGEAQGPSVTTTGPSIAGGVSDGLKAASDAVKALFAQLQTTEYLLIGGVVLIVALIVFSPAGRAAGRSGVHVL